MKKYSKAKVRSISKLIAHLKRSAKDHTNGYSQYMTLSSLTGMVESGMLFLSSRTRLNDLGETMNDRMYEASFCFGLCENLAMWCLYGVPNKEAVRVTFPYRAIKEWLETLRDKNEISVFAVTKKGMQSVDARIKRVMFTDVAYRGQNTARHCYDVYSLKSKEEWQDERLSGVIKDYAWAYENEVRLILEFSSPIVGKNGRSIETIAIDFEDPVAAIKSGEASLISGPWRLSKLAKGRHRICGHDLQFEESKLRGLVKCRCNDKAAYKRFRSMKKGS